jgi:hypothetical protein
MQKRHFVCSVGIFDGSGYSWGMCSIGEENKDDAIYSVWHDILQLDYEDDGFDGLVMLYDTVKRERVYYFHRTKIFTHSNSFPACFLEGSNYEYT